MRDLYSRKQKRIFLVVIIFALGLFILYGLSGYLTAVIGAAILYVLFKRPFDYFVTTRKWNKTAVTIGLILFSLLIIVLPFLFLSVMLTNRIISYSQNLDQLVGVVRQLEQRTGIKLSDEGLLRTVAERGGTFVANLFPSLINGALELFLIIGLMYFILFYMYVSEETMRKSLRDYLPFNDVTMRQMYVELQNSINANVIGQGLISLVQAGLVSLGFVIFGLQDALFWGMISFFASFIPVLGTPLIWGPAGLIAIAQGQTGNGVGLLLWGAILVVNIDNVLRLTIAKRLGDIHPLITILGVVIGVPFFGIIGLVIGPLLISYFLLLVRVYKEQQELATRARQRMKLATANNPEAPLAVTEEINRPKR
ncbi:MAG: AI-2E family transporter [Ferruginibacter sp.]|nr:AI-2E family transporter [Cytophagales bacterium]